MQVCRNGSIPVSGGEIGDAVRFELVTNLLSIEPVISVCTFIHYHFANSTKSVGPPGTTGKSKEENGVKIPQRFIISTIALTD